MNTNTQRRTAKYYRDILGGNDINAALRVLPEVIKKYGKDDKIRIKEYTEFNWNHKIDGFYLGAKNGKVCVDIYWQGDSTDGNDSLYISECINGKTIPAESEWLGDRTYYRHGDLRISADEVRDAVKAVAKYLSPDEMKARKEKLRKSELTKQILGIVDELSGGRYNNSYWNGKRGVLKLLEKEPELFNKSIDELKPIVVSVFRNNYCYNTIREYNLSY